jgi:quercetin dioxygenase-like cupin family protein
MIVWWKMKAGAHAAAHRHPHEQIVWMLKGKMDFRIGNDRKSMVSGDVAVIPGNTEHEGIFPEDTEVIDIFAPPREDSSLAKCRTTCTIFSPAGRRGSKRAGGE